MRHQAGKDGGNPLAWHTASHSLFNTGLVSWLWPNFNDFGLRLSTNLSDYLLELDTGSQSLGGIISRSTYFRRSSVWNHLIDGIYPRPRWDLRMRCLLLLRSSARSSPQLPTNSKCFPEFACLGSLGLIYL